MKNITSRGIIGIFMFFVAAVFNTAVYAQDDIFAESFEGNREKAIETLHAMAMPVPLTAGRTLYHPQYNTCENAGIDQRIIVDNNNGNVIAAPKFTEEEIQRFNLGNYENLPQVTASYCLETLRN